MSENLILVVHSGHNASAALMRNGVIVTAAQEERFCKKKNYVGYPKQAIDHCLKKGGISGPQLNRIAYATLAFGSSIFIKAKTSTQFSLRDYREYYGDKYFGRKMKGEDCTDYLRWLDKDEKFNQDEQYFDFSFLTDEVMKDSQKDNELFRQERIRLLSSHLGVPAEKIEFIDHHACHAYYAYYGSPFRGRDCAVVTMDGWGDGRNQTVWKAGGAKLELLAESSENDLGRIYKMATLLLAMRPDEHEFKVMGLAPYAKESHVARALKVIENLCDVEGMRIISKDRPADLYSYLKEAWEIHRFDNIAGAVQTLSERIAQKLFRNIAHETGIHRFVISGGIAMNIKMNKSISEVDEVHELFVCGSGGDESLSIGGCYFLNEANGNNKPLDHLYLGADLNDEIGNFDINSLTNRFDVDANATKSKVAQLLFNGDIVGVARGCAEFGARALGNRSILANPSKRESVQKINEAIKNRDFWMPFALSILEERHQDYLLNPKNLMSPFMAISLDAKLENYRDIEAGTHPYDKTVRPQFVSKEFSPQYHELISEFQKISGVPALLNTSFNLHGEPIVDTVSDAVRTFELSGLDHLYLNDKILISKRH